MYALSRILLIVSNEAMDHAVRPVVGIMHGNLSHGAGQDKAVIDINRRKSGHDLNNKQIENYLGEL